MVSMSGMNVNEGPDRAEFERENRYDLQSAREAVAEFEASGEPAIPLCDVDWGTDMVESERKSGGAQSKWESMVESGEIQLADPNAALDWPIPTLKLPDGVTSESILDDLRGDH